MAITILGGGIAGLSLAHFLEEDSLIIEKEAQLGGLARSFSCNNIVYDVGPHIIFSKNKDILKLHTSLIPTNIIRRSNRILHKGRFIKYPFENDLFSLEAAERDYCLQEFLNNPYENYPAQNMLQFFLKTFGEGITKLYLQPYNEKIWKFDPALLNTKMVERIPKPPREDVIKSAQGIITEGYPHQLYFHYPEQGGFQSLVNAYHELIKTKSQVITSTNINKIERTATGWQVTTDKGQWFSEVLINCMPLHELFSFLSAPTEIIQCLNDLKYNSIYIVVIQTSKDNLGDNFSINISDKEILFHRISKLDFLGTNYCLKNGSTILTEVTFRPHSYLAGWSEQQVKEKVIQDLEKLNLVHRKDISAIELRAFKYAYVVYDLNHQQNISSVLSYLSRQGIYSCGRFAEFEYMNSDTVVEHSQKLAKELNARKKC